MKTPYKKKGEITPRPVEVKLAYLCSSFNIYQAGSHKNGVQQVVEQPAG